MYSCQQFLMSFIFYVQGCRQLSIPVWHVKINSLLQSFFFCIASQRVEENSTISKLVLCLPPHRKPLAVRKGRHYLGGKMGNEHSQDNMQCIYNIVTSNLSNLMIQKCKNGNGKMEYKVHQG